MIILYLLLTIQTLSNLLVAWFLYKSLPAEKQAEVKKETEKVLHPVNEGKVMEWVAPKSELEKAEEIATKHLNLK